MKKLFLLAALFIAAAFPSCSKHDGVETPDLPDPQPLAIVFAEGNSLQFDVDETKTVHYTITGGGANNVVKAEMQNPDGAYALSTTQTSATEGTIKITAKTPTDNRVIVTVSDGSQTVTAEIAVSAKPIPEELVITFAEGNSLEFNVGETKTVHYTITGGSDKTVVKAELQNPDNDNAYEFYITQTSATEGTIKITVKIPSTDNRVIITVSNGSQTIMAAIDVTIKLKASFDGKTVEVKTAGTLSKLLADYDKTTITDLTVIGNLNDKDIATLEKLPNLAVLDMEHVNLKAFPVLFYEKTSLISIKLPLTLKTIPNSSFRGCSNLTSITIPDSVTSIENYAFIDCNSLTGVYITDIAKWCAIEFYRSSSNPLVYAQNLYLNGELITDELVIPDSVTSIGSYAFSNYSRLTSVTIPDSVTSIGFGAFSNCSSLTSVTIPDSVTSIGMSAFFNCSSLTSVTIPDGVTTIGSWAFQYCSSLTSITIPNSVTTIGERAFEDCRGLTSVTIGNGVTSIGSYAFYNCRGLASIYCKAQTPPTISSTAFSSWGKCTIYVPIGCKEAYAAADNWKQAKEIIEMEFE